MPLFQKKIKDQDLEKFRDITDDVIEADFVPYACHWDPSTVVTKNGEILQTIQITSGVDHAAPGEENEDLRSYIRKAITDCIESTQYGVWIHTVRRKQNLQVGGAFHRDFAGYLDRYWSDRNDWENQFVNEVYITVVREGQAAKLTDPKGFVHGILPRVDMRKREAFLDEARDRLTVITDHMLSVLAPFAPKRLGMVEKDGVFYSEPCKFLGKLVTLLDNDYPMRELDIAHYLTDYDVTFGFNAMEVRMRSDGKRRFGTMLTLKDYRELAPALLNTILQVPAEFIISQCFDFIHSKRALRGFQYQNELFTTSNSPHLAEKTGLSDIMGSHRGKATDFGLHQVSIFLLADTIKGMETAVGRTAKALNSLGVVTLREDIKFEECYWAQLPANFEFIRRMLPINTARLGGFANLSHFSVGRQEGNHWGPAVSVFRTVDGAPYFFNFHVAAKGHTIVAGPPGAGTTVLVNFLLAESRRYDGKLFIFDTGRSAEIFLRSIGGHIYNPYPGADARGDTQLALNPFQLEDTPANRLFLAQWLTLLLGDGSAASRAAAEEAVAAVMQAPLPERRLSALSTHAPALAHALAPWLEGGSHASIFDNAEDTLALDKVCGFEMQDAVRDPLALAPLMFYLRHRVTLALDGTPGVIAARDAWQLFEHPIFLRDMGEWLDGLSAGNAIALFATEAVNAHLESALNPVLLPHIATRIFLPDEAADVGYHHAFGLSEDEVSYLTMMNTDDRHFLVCREGKSHVIELNLAGMRGILAVLSAGTEPLAVMEKAITERGALPSEWMPRFLENL